MSVTLGPDEQAALLEILEPTGTPQWARISDIDGWALRASAKAIAHDLREPILGIRRLAGWLAELAEDGERERSERYRLLLEERLTRMERRYDALRRFIESGLSDTEPSDVAIAELCCEIGKNIGARENKAVTVSMGDGPSVIRTGRAALHRCLRELIANGIVHHDRDEVCISVQVTAAAGAHRIEIEDDGPGTNVANLDELFEPFAGGSGSGMGLAITRRTAALRGGWCDLELGSRGLRSVLIWPL